jgi:hypothetical protein
MFVVYVGINSVLEWLHHVDGSNIAEISEVQATFIFRVEMWSWWPIWAFRDR